MNEFEPVFIRRKNRLNILISQRKPDFLSFVRNINQFCERKNSYLKGFLKSNNHAEKHDFLI